MTESIYNKIVVLHSFIIFISPYNSSSINKDKNNIVV